MEQEETKQESQEETYDNFEIDVGQSDTGFPRMDLRTCEFY